MAQGLARVIFPVFATVAPQTPIEDKTVMKKVNWSIEQNIYGRETEFLAEFMKKVNWSIEQNIYGRETEFLAELQKQ